MHSIPEALAIAHQHHQAGRLPSAEQIYRQILELDPNQVDALHLLGVLAHQAGRPDLAIVYIGRAIALNGDEADFHHNRAKAYYASGRLPEAIEGYRRALELKPDFAVAHDNLGLALMEQGKLDEAIASFHRALDLDPHSAGALNNLGNALRNQGKLAEAIHRFGLALAIEPGFFAAQNNLGNALSDQGKAAEAVACLRQAVQMSPNFAGGLYNLGNALFAQSNLEEAVACYRQALRLAPAFAQAHNNLGLALVEQGKLEEAITCYRQAVALDPQHREAHSNLALPLLLLGRFEEGWMEYEWRLALGSPQELAAPRWNGAQVEGETILLFCEQGFGDSIHFIRFAELLRERSKASRIILECPAPLARLFAQSAGEGIQVVARGAGHPEPLPSDWHLPLLSAPFALRLLEPLPMSAPYLHADPDLRATWRERLGPRGPLRVGLAWQGNPTQSRDRVRSIPPEQFLPLLKTDGAAFYSLQIETSGIEARALERSGLIDFTSQITDFADTAAFLAELDLVIAVDTAIVHLAGALGRPVWNLLTMIPHWPWGLHGGETPWYPTMRLFRQTERGGWGSVVQRVGEELARFVRLGEGRA